MTPEEFVQKFGPVEKIKRNDNCLTDKACPKCGNRRRLLIESTCLMDVSDDGTDSYGDVEWGDRSYARCYECDHEGHLEDFTIEDLDVFLAEPSNLDPNYIAPNPPI